MRLHYTLFAQNPSGDLSDGLEATVNAQEANYGLFSIDNSGQVSDAVSIKIIYVLNNYTLYGNYLGEFSTPLSDSCIVAPMQVPRNLRVVEQYTTHKTIKLKWDAIEGIERYAIYVRDLETSEAWNLNLPRHLILLLTCAQTACMNSKLQHTYNMTFSLKHRCQLSRLRCLLILVMLMFIQQLIVFGWGGKMWLMLPIISFIPAFRGQA